MWGRRKNFTTPKSAISWGQAISGRGDCNVLFKLKIDKGRNSWSDPVGYSLDKEVKPHFFPILGKIWVGQLGKRNPKLGFTPTNPHILNPMEKSITREDLRSPSWIVDQIICFLELSSKGFKTPSHLSISVVKDSSLIDKFICILYMYSFF